MKKVKFSFYLILSFLAISFLIPTVSAQEQFLTSTFTSPEEVLHAASATRFHFISLNNFRSSISSVFPVESKVSEADLSVLNAGLNAFLTSPGREAVLLDALRYEKAIRVSFVTPQGESVADLVKDPSKPLLYRFEPESRAQYASVEIQPLLDGPNAFRILVKKDMTYLVYDINWAGNIAHFKQVPIK